MSTAVESSILTWTHGLSLLIPSAGLSLSVVAITLSGISGDAFRSSRHMFITRAYPLPFWCFSDIEQQFLHGWEIIVFLATAATVAISGIKSVRSI